VIVGQDTDSESTLLGARLEWLAKFDKDDFVGRAALAHAAAAEPGERLVGFAMREDVLPPEGAQVVRGDRPVGRVTSARRSALAGRPIGLAWVPPDLAEDGAELAISVDGATRAAVVQLEPFHDPAGERLRA
jgi:glycine cleavage system aminomethyltransferase T